MTTIIIGAVFVVIGTLAYMALKNAQDFSDANEIIPGVPTKAPKEWAGAHSLEAKLHRRLRDALEPLRATASLDRAGLGDLREQLEQHALRTDEHLISVAALPKSRREAPMADIAKAVDAIEATVADIIALRGPEVEDVDAGIEAVRTRLRFVAEARAELEAFDQPSPDLTDLRRRLDPGGQGEGDPGAIPDLGAIPEPGAGPEPGSDPGTPA